MRRYPGITSMVILLAFIAGLYACGLAQFR